MPKAVVNVVNGVKGTERYYDSFLCNRGLYHHSNYEFNSSIFRGILDTTLSSLSVKRQIGGFLWVIRFSPPIKLIATILLTKRLLKVALYTHDPIRYTPMTR